MKDEAHNWLAEYLMEHGILKNADAEVMAKEIEARFGKELKEAQSWADELASDLCKIEDAMGFKQDQHNLDGSWKPTMECVMEKIRDWVKQTADFEDAKRENAQLAAQVYRGKDYPSALYDSPSKCLRDLLTPTELVLADCFEACEPPLTDRIWNELARLRAVVRGTK